MRMTRKSIIGVVAAASLATVAAVAYAFPPGAGPGSGGCAYGAGSEVRGGPGMMGRGGPGMMGGHGYMGRGGYGPGAGAGPAANADARLSFLKGELKITADQETAWDAYATQVKQQAGAMQALHTQAATAGQTAPDRYAQRAEFAKQRAAHMEAMSAAVKDLYAVLTPEQKALADQHFGGPRMGPYGGTRGYGQRGYGPSR